ncbi:recombinase family protein [Hymenobacter sp. BT770]|nr:recombinase family protein [Hymenobacter sp. BT770]MCC3154616.1 recombinase family protein [Hymenobacter sp. BT770]MDO3416670.1 recombinase family protein [Hymenobacter sp. BT770]
MLRDQNPGTPDDILRKVIAIGNAEREVVLGRFNAGIPVDLCESPSTPGCRPATKARTRRTRRTSCATSQRSTAPCYKVFTEEVSGSKSDCTEFKQQLLEAYQKKFDLVAFWRLDRFSREGALPTLKYLKELRDHGVNYKSFTEPYLDSLGPFGDIIVSVLATIAAQDLIKILENTKALLAKKKAAGIKLEAPTKTVAVVEQTLALKGEGNSNGYIARAQRFHPARWPSTSQIDV